MSTEAFHTNGWPYNVWPTKCVCGDDRVMYNQSLWMPRGSGTPRCVTCQRVRLEDSIEEAVRDEVMP